MLASAPAQEPQPKIEPVRQIEGLNWVLRLDGTEVQTITLDQKRQLLKDAIELENLRQQVAALKEQIGHYEVVKSLFERDAQRADQQIKLLSQSVEMQQAQIQELNQLLTRAVTEAKRGRVSKALDSPILALLFRVAVPLAGAIFAVR